MGEGLTISYTFYYSINLTTQGKFLCLLVNILQQLICTIAGVIKLFSQNKPPSGLAEERKRKYLSFMARGTGNLGKPVRNISKEN